jgi:hypothetical protein
MYVLSTKQYLIHHLDLKWIQIYIIHTNRTLIFGPGAFKPVLGHTLVSTLNNRFIVQAYKRNTVGASRSFKLIISIPFTSRSFKLIISIPFTQALSVLKLTSTSLLRGHFYSIGFRSYANDVVKLQLGATNVTAGFTFCLRIKVLT